MNHVQAATSTSNKDLIQWPSFKIEDTLISADCYAPDHDDGWGEPQAQLDWSVPKFTMIERQRSTPFWNPNESLNNPSPSKAASHKQISLYPWRRRREDLSVTGIVELQNEPDIYEGDSEHGDYMDRAAPCLERNIHDLYVPSSSPQHQSRIKDPNQYFAKILEPEEFLKQADIKSTTPIVSVRDKKTSALDSAASCMAHNARYLQDPLVPVKQSQALAVDIPMRKSRMTERWNAVEVHILDGIAANLDFAPLKPCRARNVLQQDQEKPNAQPPLGEQGEVAKEVLNRQMTLNIMDEEVEAIPYATMTPVPRLLSM